jgi:cytochrome P450
MKVEKRLATFDDSNADRPDLLSHFLDMRKSYPDVVTDEQVFIYSLTNVIAGSLSTSHVLDEIVRYLTTNPSAQQRICDELKQAVPELRFPIMFDDAKKSPYLEAVIQEGIRIHSMANLSSERVVGPGGMVLPSGMVLPAGTYVGINPAAMNRRLDVYGPHTSQFDPGETEQEFSERRLGMDRAGLTFGHGSRSCLGKNIVQLELMKLIASLCHQFKVSLSRLLSAQKLIFLQFEGIGEQELYKVFCKVERRKL